MAKIIPTIFVGLGGTGFYAISQIKKTIAKKYFDGDTGFPLNAYLAVDTEFLTADKVSKMKDRDELNFVTTFDPDNIVDAERIETRVTPGDVKSKLRNPNATHYGDFIPSGAAEHIEVGGDGASGIGLVGKIALADNFTKVANRLKTLIQELMGHDVMNRLSSNSKYAKYSREGRMNIFIFCSFGGGTGKGMALVFSAMSKELLDSQFSNQRDRYNVSVINYLPDCFKARGRSLANDNSTFQYILKNQYATYKEFDWCVTNGYENEEFFRKYFKKGGLKPKTENFVNSIYNISPKLEMGGREISSYGAINDVVADVFSFLTMNEDAKEILQSASNDTSKKDAAIPEKETGLVRNLKYCRIGKYSIKLPEKRLFEYAELFYTNELLIDFLEGGLERRVDNSKYEDLRLKPTDHKWHPEKLAQTEYGNIERTFTKHYQPFVQVTNSFIYPDVHSYQETYFTTPFEESISKFKGFAEGFETNKKVEVIQKEFIDDRALQLLKDFGLLHAKNFFSSLSKSLERNTQTFLEKTKDKNDLGAKVLLRALGESDPYSDTSLEYFDFTVGPQVLNRLDEHFENGRASLLSYTTHEKFKLVSSIVAKLAKPKKKNIVERIFGTVDDEKIPFPEDGKAAVNKIVNQCNDELERLWPIFQAREYLSMALQLNNHLQKRLKAISLLIDELRSEDKKEGKNNTRKLLEELSLELTELGTLQKEANENFIVGDNKDEFELFCRKVLPYQIIIDDLHHRFNSEFIQKLFTSEASNMIRDLFAKTKNYSQDRLKSEQYDEQKHKKWSIISYLKYLVTHNEVEVRQQIDENLKKMQYSSYYLSAVDTNKFTEPGAAEASFPQQNFLEISDEQFLPNHVEHWQTYTHSAKLIPQSDDEEITLTRVQGLIPLFGFKDLQEAQNLYLDQVNNTVSEKERQRFLVKAHSSTYFMTNIQEPFGQSIQIDKSELIGIWNMAYHLDIVDVDIAGYIKMIKKVTGSAKESYEDPNKKNAPTSKERWVKATNYSEDYGNQFFLTQTIINLIFEKLKIMADNPPVGHAILESYLTNKNYPVIPKSLYDTVTNNLSKENKYTDLVEFFTLKGQAYRDLYGEISDIILRKQDFAFNLKQLENQFPNAPRPAAFYEKVSKEAGNTNVITNELAKVEGITLDTTWLLFSDKDKNNPLNGGNSYTSFDAQQLHLNEYSNVVEVYFVPEDQHDVVLGYKDFESVLNKLTRFIVGTKKLGKGNFRIYKKVKDYFSEIKLTDTKKGLPWLQVDEVIQILEKDQELLVTQDEKLGKDGWVAWQEVEVIADRYNGTNIEEPDFEEPDF